MGRYKPKHRLSRLPVETSKQRKQVHLCLVSEVLAAVREASGLQRSNESGRNKLSWVAYTAILDDVKLAAPCTSVYAGQVKDPTHGVNV